MIILNIFWIETLYTYTNTLTKFSLIFLIKYLTILFLKNNDILLLNSERKKLLVSMFKLNQR